MTGGAAGGCGANAGAGGRGCSAEAFLFRPRGFCVLLVADMMSFRVAWSGVAGGRLKFWFGLGEAQKSKAGCCYLKCIFPSSSMLAVSMLEGASRKTEQNAEFYAVVAAPRKDRTVRKGPIVVNLGGWVLDCAH